MARIFDGDDAFNFKLPMFDFTASIRAAALPDLTGILAAAQPTADFTSTIREAVLPAINLSDAIRVAAVPDLTGILGTQPKIDFADVMRTNMPAINISDAVFAATRPTISSFDAVLDTALPPMDMSAFMPDLSTILGLPDMPTFGFSDVFSAATLPATSVIDAVRTVRIAEAALRAAGEDMATAVDELETYDLSQLLRPTGRIAIQTAVAIVVYCAAISYVVKNYEFASTAGAVFGPNPLVVAIWAWALTGWLLKQLNPDN